MLNPQNLAPGHEQHEMFHMPGCRASPARNAANMIIGIVTESFSLAWPHRWKRLEQGGRHG
jgi:hypothetical protein